jgi:hypothetical protein
MAQPKPTLAMSSSLNSCPVATANASADHVWYLLADPARYASWWEAQTRSILPEGPAQAGQRVLAQVTALGMRGKVDILVEAVDAGKRQIDLLTRLPLGITVRSHIVCTPLGSRQARVSFG